MNLVVESNQKEFELRKKFFDWVDKNPTRPVWAWILENFEPKVSRVELPVILQNAGQGRTIKILQDCLHEKNLDLDAMGFIWCDGGCEGGVYRYNNKELTEEILQRAEKNVKRMRTWFENNKDKKSILSK